MADIYMKSFNKRVHRLNKKHRKMANGIVHSVNHDGLIVARARRRGPRLPLKGIALLIVAFIGFKAFLLIYLGQAAYGERVEQFRSGTAVEQAGAYVMAPDPLTVFIATEVNRLLK
jgi:hypothetical protein